MCKTKHMFVYDNHFKPLHQSKRCRALIDNRADAPIRILEDKEREKDPNLWHDLNMFLEDCALWNMYTK